MFKPVQGTKLYELVIKQIESQILHGIYKRGEMLPSEKELMSDTGVSRITVREALRILADAGVIETIRGKGSRVLVDGISLARRQKEIFKNYQEQFLQTVKARLLIEPEIARYVASKATPADIERICSAVCIAPPSAIRPERAKEAAVINFHRTIVEAAGNAYLLDFFDHILDIETLPRESTFIPPSMQHEIFLQLNEQHRKIAEAIQNHNGEFAYFYMKEHTLFVEQIYLDYFSNFDAS